MATEAEIAWAAGIFEGEGSFHVGKAGNRKVLVPTLHLGMTDRDTVQRWRDILDAGNVIGPKQRGPGRKPMYTVDVCGRSTVKQVILDFLPWLGARRTARAHEVLAIIEELDAAAEQRAHYCPAGHLRTPENTYVNPRGYSYCRDCKRPKERERMRHKRATDPEFAERGREYSRNYARRKRAGAKLKT